MENKRHKVWIDRFQTSISIRIAFYFVIYQVFVWAAFLIGRYINDMFLDIAGEGATGFLILFTVVTSVTLGVLFIRDALAHTHRLVGPLHRLRKTIQAIAAGEELEPLQLRKDDYLQELKEEFNEMLTALEQRGAIQLKTSSPVDCLTSAAK